MKIAELPDSPGVYLFMNSSYKVIYVGKVKSLKKRVKSHFTGDQDDAKHIAMISQTRTLDFIETLNEEEALVLEDQLIKNLMPRYNVALKDDKTYPYIEVTAGDRFPVIKVTRSKKNNKSRYFGPFPNARDIRSALRTIDRIFTLRKCGVLKEKTRPCLNYQIGKCLSPCSGKISEIEYSDIVDEIILFLSGKQKSLRARLKKKMEFYKNKTLFESAAAIRDQLAVLDSLKPRISIRKITKKKIEALNKIDPHYLLKEFLSLKHKPSFIEGYDISHISSKEAVGSKVAFIDGFPKKDLYRKYKIKQAETSDDLKMMQEVLFRRFKRAVNEKERLPDIVLIDGGKNHEKIARNIIKQFELNNITVISLAKEFKNVYFNGKVVEKLKKTEAINLLTSITDEAHRFANTYHALRRKKRDIIN